MLMNVGASCLVAVAVSLPLLAVAAVGCGSTGSGGDPGPETCTLDDPPTTLFVTWDGSALLSDRYGAVMSADGRTISFVCVCAPGDVCDVQQVAVAGAAFAVPPTLACAVDEVTILFSSSTVPPTPISMEVRDETASLSYDGGVQWDYYIYKPGCGTAAANGSITLAEQ